MTSVKNSRVSNSCKITLLVLGLIGSGVYQVQANNSSAGAEITDTRIDEVLANGEDEAYADYLVSECVACHDPAGKSSDGVPKIHGIDNQYIVAALLAYREGLRSDKTMSSVAESLGDVEISALAFYLAKQ